MNSEFLLFLANHLWQSTVFAAGVWLITLLLRSNRAAVRHRLWVAASIKFLLPFSVLVSLGTHFQWRTGTSQPVLIGQIATPFVPAGITPAQPVPSSRVPEMLAIVWVLGVIVNLAWWLTGWLRLHRMIRRASSLDIDIPLRVLSCPERLEPGVFGVFRPVLLLPAGITERLSPEQLQTVIAHELSHIRRRDNLTSAIHLLVEALFWFHPLLWWIKSRLIAEQERACDEEVLRLGNAPHVYAESILMLCELYIASPLICAAGVTGSNLRKRIEEIMNNKVVHPLSLSRRLALTAAAIAAVAGPVMIGASGVKATPPEVSERPAAMEPAPKPPQPAPVQNTENTSASYLRGLGTVVASNTVTIRSRVDGELLSVGFKEGETVQAGQLLASIDSKRLDLQRTADSLTQVQDTVELVEARKQQDPLVIAQIEAKIAADKAAADKTTLQLSYTQIRSPITGIAGLRQVDPGNTVHPSDPNGIVVIAQVQPIAVVFTIPEDNLQPVLALLRSGVEVPVEVWNRDATAKLATGRLAAVDNQIDSQTGTAKLKALFDNQDNALFPNQFVNVRLMANGR